MAYGTVKVDNITFTNGGVDQTVTVSGIVQSISGNITATGTIQAATIIGTSTVSGATVTGNAGVFTTVTGGSAGFTTVTGTTVTGTTANFATLSGTTITGSVGNFGSGSAAAPSVSVGSTDNGIYSPGADQVAISTNGTGRLFVNDSGTVTVSSAALNFGTGGVSGFISANNYWGASSSDWNFNAGHLSQNFIWKTTSGTERMRLDSSGRLGLGTSSPGSLLDLVGGDIRLDSVYGINKSNADGYIHLSGGTSNALGGTIFCFGQSHAGNANEIHFRNSGNQTRAVIDSSGRLGVGTTSPGTPLDVSGIIRANDSSSDGNAGLLIATDAAARGYIGTAYWLNGGSETDIGYRVESGNNHIWMTGTSERARIDSSGRLLVGTSSGSDNNAFLKVQSNAGGATGAGWIDIRRGSIPGATNNQLGLLSFSDSSGNSYAYIEAYTDETPGTNDYPGRLVFSTTADGASSPTERLRITSDGKVGLGTSAPGANLEVYGAQGTILEALRLRNQNAGVAGVRQTFWQDYLVAAFTASRNGLDGRLSLQTTDTSGNLQDRLYIDGSGRVGVGSTGPLAKLAVEYAVAGSGSDGIRLSDTTNTTVTLLGTTETTYSYAGVTGHNTLLYGSRDLAICADNANSGQIKFATGGSEAMRIDASRRLLVGTSSARGYGDGNIPFVQVERATIGGDIANIGVCNNGDNGAGPKFTLAKSRAGSNGGSTVVQNGDSLGSIQWSGADGTDIESVAAQITCNVDGTPGANDMPGRLVFSTTADGAASPTERMRIDSSGRVGVGTSTPSFPLEVRGSTNNLQLLGSDNVNATWRIGTPSSGVVAFGGNTDHNVAFGGFNAATNAFTERCRLDSSGRLLVGTSSSTMSGGVVQQNGNLGIIANTATNVATSGTLDITVNSGGGCFTGFMIVENTLATNAASRTQTLYAVMGRGTSATFTSLATADGSTSGASFSLSCPSNGVIRVTNTHGGATNINLCWYGPTGY